MAAYSKILGQSAPAAATMEDLYIVADGRSAVTSTITVCNRDVSGDVFSIYVSEKGEALDDKQHLYSGVNIPGNETFAATIGIALSSGDVVRVWSQNGTCSFNIFGIEEK